MERRVLLAAVLSAVVLLMWYAFVAPPETARRPVGEQVPGFEEATPVAETAPTPVPIESADETATIPLDAPAAVRGSGEQQVVVEGQGVRAVVNSLGGVVESLVVEGYTNYEREPLELVADDEMKPLCLASEGPWNREPYAVERTADGVRLHWSDGRGNWVDKLIESGGGPYGLRVRVEMGGSPAANGVVVATSLRRGESAEQARFARSDAVVYAGGDLERINPAKLKGPEVFVAQVAYAGTESQYFLEVLLPDGDVDRVEVRATQEGDVAGAAVVVVGRGGVLAGTLFGGPKEHRTLVVFGKGLEETLSFGIFGVLSVGFLSALRWIYGWTANWGVAIIVLTAAIRVVLFPLTHKSTVAMRRMQKLQPKMKAIQGRYQDRAKKDPAARTRMNQEIMGLYKQEGVNPMGGCLPTLVQLPILWALYTLFAYAIELRQAPFMFWIHDLSLKDPTYVLPILMMISMFVQQRLAPQTGDPTQRRMFMMMPLVFGFMFMSFPAGLVLYWLVNNLLTIGQQLATEAIMRRTSAVA